MSIKFKVIICVVLIGLVYSPLSAANRYFKSGATVWNDANSWSATSSAGVDNAGVPGSSDIAFFDADSGSCLIDANVDVLGIDTAGYAGTLTQGNFTITVRGSSLLWKSGNFVGSASAISVISTGSFILTGGVFTATSGDFTCNNHFTLTSGTFNHNSGTVIMNTGTNATITSGNLYNLTIVKSTFALTITNTCTVNNNLVVTSAGSAGGSNIEIHGNMTFNSNNSLGSIYFIAVGANNQSVSGTGSVGCNFEINKSGGTLTFTSSLSFERDYIYTGGTVDWSTNTATFKSSANTIIVSGTFYNLVVTKGGFSFTLTNNTIVNNTLTINSMASCGGSNMEVLGNIVFNSSSLVGSANKILVNGTGNQSVTASASCGSPIGFEINKASGTLSFDSDVKFNHNYTLVSGTVNWNTFKATFSGAAHSTITNAGTFYNMEVNKTSSYNLVLSGDINVTNNLTLNTTNQINSGNIYFGNTLICSGTVSGGTGKVMPAATGNQTTSGSANIGCALEVNKTSGQFDFGANYQGINSTSGNINFVAGTINQNNYTITAGRYINVTGGVFNGSASNITALRFIQTDGIFTSTSGTLQVGVAGSGNYSFDITGGIFNHNNGSVLVSGSNHSGWRTLETSPLWNFEAIQCPTCSNVGTIYVDNLCKITNTASGGLVVLKGDYQSVAGSPSLTLTGGNNQTITATATVGSVTINKSGGNVEINRDIAWNGAWNYIAGNINWNNYTAKCVTNFNGSNEWSNAQFYNLEIAVLSGVGIATLGVAPIVTNNLNMNCAAGAGTVPSVFVRGNVSFTTSNGAMSVLTLDGTGTQNISGVGTCNAILNINKASGSAELSANLTIAGAGRDLLLTNGELNLNGFNVVVPDLFTVIGKLKLKGSETITVNSIVAPATNVKFSFATGSTVEFFDPAVTAVLTNLTKTYYNLILGANKTHEVATGGGNGITVNGFLSTSGTNATRSILRSVSDAASTWELTLNGTSLLDDKVDVKYSNASSGLIVWALNSVDSTNNTNWNFITYPDFTWTGALDNNWNNAGNWVGGVVPGNSDTATFVSAYNVDCNINATVNVNRLRIVNGYASTITQGAFDITIGAGSFQMSSGVFSGSGNSVTVTGNFQQDGGVFTSTSGTLNIGGFALNGGTFNTNNGTFQSTSFNQSDGVFNGSASPITISGPFSQNGGTFNNTSNTLVATTLEIFGGVFDGSSGSITLGTSFSQTGGSFTSTSGTLQVTSSASTVFATTNGTFIHNSGTVRVQGSSTPAVSTTGLNRLYHLTFTTPTTVGGTLYVDGNLNVGTVNNYASGTTIFLKGDCTGTINNSNTGTFSIVGTGDQNFSINRLPTTVINKPSGTLIFGNSIIAGTGWTHTKGAINWNGFSCTFPSTGSFTTITSGNFYDLIINNNNSLTLAGSDCIVANKYTSTNVSGFNASSFHLKVAGDVEFTDAAYSVTSAGQKMILNGSGTQNITGAGVCGHNLEINKSSGIVTLGANLTLPNTSRNLTITAGELYLNGYNVTVATLFTVNGKLSLKGSETITVNSIVAPDTNANFAINSGSTIEFKDSGVVGIVTNLTKTFHHLILGSGKTHEFATGVSNRVTVNGTLSSAGNSGSRSVLRSVSDAASTWELKLNGTSALTDNVNVKYSDASSGSTIFAIGSVDGGNNTNWMFSTKVLSLNSSTANGSYKLGSVVGITVNFNVAVTVTGTPTLILETGAVDRTVSYVSGSGSAAIVFSYTVQAGDTSLDLDTVDSSSLSLNGGTIKDILNNDADLTLPNPGDTDSLSFNKAIVIDTTDPAITAIISSTPDGSYKAGSNISITVNFGEPITLVGTMGVNLDSGGLCVINAFSGTSATGTYTVLASETSSDLTATSVVVSGTARDTATNELDVSLPPTNIATGSNIVIDTTAPTITSITSSTADGSYGVGANVTIRINFSESITLTGTMGINLDSGGICVINGFTGTTATGVYTVLAGETSADLTASSVTINSTAQDVALNNLNTGLPGSNIATGSNIVIDGVVPYITSITSLTPSGIFDIGGNISLTINFSESVTLTGTMGVNLDSGGVCVINSFTGTTASGVYTVQVGENSANLIASSISITGTTKDVALNDLTTTLPVSNISNSWLSQKSHVINSATGAGTNYQVKITVHYGAGVDSGSDVYLAGKCQGDFDDIRFTSADGLSYLAYWLEEKVDSNYAIFWVKISADISSSNATILVNYGNPNLSSNSNGNNTFLFFDDFTNDLSKWIKNKTSGVYPEIPSGQTYLRAGGGNTSGSYGHTSIGSSNTFTGFNNNAVRFRARSSTDAIGEVAFRGNFASNLGYKARLDARAGKGQAILKPPYVNGGWSFISTEDGVVISTNTWYKYEVTMATSDIKFYRDEVLRRSVTDASYALAGEIALQNHYGSYTDFDWVFVRKFVATEPVHGAWGAESQLENSVVRHIVDTATPTITSIVSSSANGSYKVGANISIRINFSESITLTGTMGVNLDSGGTCIIYPFVGTTATGVYTVLAGQNSLDLTATSITVNTSAKDVANKDLDTSLPVTNIATNSNIVIDTTAPTITSITSSTIDGSYKAGANISIRINFSESITLTGTMGINLDTGGVCVITGFTGTTATGVYTVLAGHSSLDLTVTSVTVNTTARDAALNDLNTALPGTNIATGSNIVIDTTAPTITSITSSTVDGDYNAGANISIRINFSESITLTGTMGINLDSGGVCVINGFTGTTATGVYTVLAGHSSLDLTATSVTVNTTARDAALNDLNTALPGTNIATGSNIVIDTTAPTITSITSSTVDGNYKAGANISIRINFSESITLTGTMGINLDSGGVCVISGFTGTTTTGVYTVLAGHSSLDLTATSVTVNTTARDAALNDLNTALPGTNIATGSNIVIDTTAPTITSITSSTADGVYGIGSNISIRINFSESITLTGTMGINLDSGGVCVISGFTGTTATGVYTVLAGHSSLDLTASSVTINTTARDVALNDLNTALPGTNIASGSNIVIDTSAPTITSITSSTVDGVYGIGANISVRINFSESITLTGTMGINLDSGGVCVISGFTGTTATGVYTVLVGHNSLDLTASSITVNTTARDVALNDLNTALPGTNIATGSNIVIDTTAPTITSITSSTTDGYYKAGANISIRINFSESITLTGTMGINLDSGGICVISGFTGTTTTSVYTVLTSQNSLDLTATSVTVNTSARDAALNDLNTALPGTNIATGSNIVIDTTSPTITSITSSTADGAYGIGANISIRINFSESITLTGTMGINLDSGGVCVISGFTGTTATGVYTVLAGQNSLDLSATSVTVNSTAQDQAINDLNTALPGTNIATGSNIVIDTLAPYITSILSSTASGFYKEGDVISITISFSEPVTLASGTLSVNLSSGGSIEYGAFTGTSTTGVYTVLAGENTLTLNATACNLSGGTFLDLGGSSVLLNLPGTNISPSKTIVVDTIAPTIASFALGAASAFLDVSFSEAVYSANTGTGAVLISDFNLVFDQNGGSATSASISGITKVSGDPLEGGEITYRLALSVVGIIAGVETITVNPVSSEIFDRSGNPASVTTTTGAIVLSDLTAPNITNVSSPKPNGVYKAGEVIDIEISFSENVTVSGTPSIKLANGGSGTDALYLSGSGTGTLTFRYIVVSGDNNSVLDYQNTTSLFLNSGSIKDVSNNDATLVLPAPGTVSSLGFNKNIMIDTIVPTMVSGVLDTANTYVDITFSENIYATGSTTPITANDLELIFASNGGSATAASILSLSKIPSGALTGGEDKVRVMISVAGSVSGQETILIRAATNKIFDKAGNAMASTPNTGVLDLVVSGTTPIVTKVYSLTPDGSYNENKTILIAIEFSEAVVVTGVPFLHIFTGTPNNKALYTSNLNEKTLQFEYLVQADDKTSDLEYFSTGALASGTGQIKGNTGISANVLLPVPGEVNSLGFSSNIVIDTLRPTITSVVSSISSGLYGANASIPIKILLSRNVLLENGSLIVTLNTGAKIIIDSLNSNVIDVPYITKMGDLTNHLKIKSLALSEGATIQDELGGNLNLTLINKNLEFTIIRIYAYPKDYIISSSAGENGSVSPIGDFPATEGTTVQIVITPNNNYQVDTVLVNGVSVGATNLYAFKNIQADQSIHVTFSEKTGFFNISSNAGQGGSLSVESPLQVVAGGSAKISIMPNIGFHILDVWVDGVSVGAVNSYEFINVQKNSHLEAFFAINQPEYLITSNGIGNGFISPLGHLSVIEGGDINFKITPDIGYKIKDIIVNNKSIGIVDQYSFKNVQNNNQITAVFERILKSYIIVPISLGGGSVMPSTIIEAKENSSATVSFVPDIGHHIIDVFVDRESVGKLSEYTFNEISNNHEVIAIYHPTKEKYSIVPSLNNGGKGAKFQLSAREVVAGGSTSITIKADLGYTILDIKLNKKSINFLSKLKLKNSKVKEFGSEYTFSITDADQDYFVEVEVGLIKPTYSININVIGSGMADKDSVLEVAHGANLPITFTAIKGSHLSDVIINGTNVGALSFINLENINTNFEIKAIFTKDKDFYNIKSNVIGSGEISPFGDKIVNSGQDALYTFQAQDGHQLIGLIIDEKFLDINGVIRSFGGYLFSNVLRDYSIHAVFGQITKSYTINVKLSAGGTADFTGVLNVSFGDNHLNHLSPEEGFRVSDVIIDGKSYGAISGYSLTNVNSDHNIEVKFSQEKPEYHIITSNTVGGKVLPGGVTTVLAGESLVVRIEPDEGYRILNVSLNGIDLGAVSSVLLNEIQKDQIVSVTFASASMPFTVRGQVIGGNQIISLGQSPAAAGDSVTFDYLPNVPFEIYDVKVDGYSYGPLTSFTFTNITADHLIVFLIADPTKADKTDKKKDESDYKKFGGCNYNPNCTHGGLLEYILLWSVLLALLFFIRRSK